MPRTIKIAGLKHIKNLSFDIPDQGVYLIAGPNGSGKTTLLACLRRIAWSFAFQQHFASSTQGDQLDNFSNASIRYTVGGRSVTYAYAGQRWVPTPRANSGLLQEYGFASVLYVGATAERITPRPEDFAPRRVRPAPPAIREAANRIFRTRKFDALRTINLSRGTGNSAFLIQTAAAPQKATYYSEKNFSLGELCVLKMIRDVQTIPDESLLLIDEIELALHPKVQIELFKYLTQIANEKRLTVIFSTHSVSLLKSVDRHQILYLDNQDGDVSTINGCYPTYAIGGLAYEEEHAPDTVVYVEDVAAMYVTEALLRLFLGAKFEQQQKLYPTVQVVPIGPFMSVVRFLSHGQSSLPPSTKCKALLDVDVKEETVVQWRRNQNHTLLAEFNNLGDNLKYLPWTPEVGLVYFLRDEPHATNILRHKFGDNRIRVRVEDVALIPAQAGGEQRKACKAAVRRVVDSIKQFRPNLSEDLVERYVYESFAEWHFSRARPEVMQLLGPMVA